MISKQPPFSITVVNVTILSHARNLDISFNSYSSPRYHFPVTLKSCRSVLYHTLKIMPFLSIYPSR